LGALKEGHVEIWNTPHKILGETAEEIRKIKTGGEKDVSTGMRQGREEPAWKGGDRTRGKT